MDSDFKENQRATPLSHAGAFDADGNTFGDTGRLIEYGVPEFADRFRNHTDADPGRRVDRDNDSGRAADATPVAGNFLDERRRQTG